MSNKKFTLFPFARLKTTHDFYNSHYKHLNLANKIKHVSFIRHLIFFFLNLRMARNRKAKGSKGEKEGDGKGADAARPRRRMKKKVSIPLVIKCESNLCEVLLQSLGEMQCEGLASLPRRICDRLRNGSVKTATPSQSQKIPEPNASTGCRSHVKRLGVGERKEGLQKMQRNRRSNRMKFRPRCKPLLPNRLLLTLARSMGTSKMDDAAGGTIDDNVQQQMAYAPIGAAIESFCQPTDSAYETNLMVVLSNQRATVNQTFYSWNNEPINNWVELPSTEPANIFNHIRNGLADISFMPLHEDPARLPVLESADQCNILPMTNAAASTVDIYEHIRNMLSQSPIID